MASNVYASFIAPHLLKDLVPADHFTLSRAHSETLAGKSFSQLSSPEKQRLLDYQFTVHTFPAQTDDRDVLEVFARMNATGLKLNAQELRNAEFFGFFKTQSFSLATEQLPRWRKWKIFTDGQIGRMNEVEFTSELLILIRGGISEGSAAVIDEAYADLDAVYTDRDVVAERFRITMQEIDRKLDFDSMDRMRNRTLFYCLFAAVYFTHLRIRKCHHLKEAQGPY